MRRTAHEPVKLFCSYSHRDERYLNKLKTSLAGLRREGLIEEWHDRKIRPGQEWEEAIDQALETSEVVLLLVTPDFMHSDYSFEKEMSRALDRHERGEARVVPIIVRPTDWEGAPFGKLQALPKDAKPITTWANRDRAWLDVVRGIREAIKELRGKPGERKQKTAPTGTVTFLFTDVEGSAALWENYPTRMQAPPRPPRRDPARLGRGQRGLRFQGDR